MKVISLSALLCISLTGCMADDLRTVGGTKDFITPEQLVALDSSMSPLSVTSESERNTYITEKMFVIDRQYAVYEQTLMRNENVSKFLGSLATIGLSSAAAVIPAGATTKVLNTTITAVQGTETSIDQDLLQSEAIQSIERQMRIDRNNQARLIFDRMSVCDIAHYPIYLALSDLESYRHSGTFESAIISLGKTTSLLETVSKDNKNQSTAANGDSVAALTDTLAPPSNGGTSITDCPIPNVSAADRTKLTLR